MGGFKPPHHHYSSAHAHKKIPICEALVLVDHLVNSRGMGETSDGSAALSAHYHNSTRLASQSRFSSSSPCDVPASSSSSTQREHA